MQQDAVTAEALRAILMEATGVKHQSPRAREFGSLIAEQAELAIDANELEDAQGLSGALASIQSLTQSLFLVRSAVVAPYAKAIHALSTIVQRSQLLIPKDYKMPKVTVSLEITHKKSEFASEQAMLDWIHACLNCNVNNAEVKVELTKPTVEKSDPRVLVTVNGGVAETSSDAGVDVIVFDFDNESAESGGVPYRFEDLAIRAGVPVEGAPLNAAEQPQG